MTRIDTHEQDRLVTDVLQKWADGIRAHESDRVASLFTEDAIFQGFDPTHSVGRAGVAAYYAKQPPGLTAAFRVIDRRRLADDALIAYVRVDFTRPDGTVIPVHLTVVLRFASGSWLIGHYHVSKITQ